MDTVLRSFPLLFHGAITTVWLSVVSTVLATVAGLALGLLQALAPSPVRWLVSGYVYVIQGVPALVTIFFVYYVLPLWGFNVPGTVAGVIALTVYGAAFITEIVRGGIAIVPRGQVEAGRALGMMRLALMRHVVLPQAIRFAIPPYILMAARLVRTTSIIYIVGVSELTLVSRELIARDNTPFQTLGIAMMIYFALSYPLSLLGSYLEKRHAFAQ
jgi:polar amino acid transport system permease protein